MSRGFMKIARKIIPQNPGKTSKEIARMALEKNPRLSKARDPLHSLSTTLDKLVRYESEPQIRREQIDGEFRYFPKSSEDNTLKSVNEINIEDQEKIVYIRREQSLRLRKTKPVKKIKLLYNYRCQICDKTIEIGNGRLYAEVHHVKPLGPPHEGPDNLMNMLCVCPNHHVQLTYGAIRLDKSKIHLDGKHSLNDEYIEYHNNRILISS